MNITPASPLARFRAELYQTVLGMRRDALFELLDAVLSGEGATSLVRHSLAPGCQRGWASLCDGLSEGSLDVVALRRIFAAMLPAPPPGQRPLWVIDGTIWPRPAAKTSPERTLGRFVTGGVPQSGIIGGWESQWLVAIPEAQGSWGVPLEVARRAPGAGTATTLAIGQLRAVQAARPAGAPRPLLLVDSHYDVAALVQADLGIDILARLRSNRRFYRHPGPYQGKGAPRKHGPVFRCADPSTHGCPDQTQTAADARYGQVTIDVWARLHSQPAPTVEVTVLRVTVAHLPRREGAPAPLWLVWHGDDWPEDLRILVQWYHRRFAVEHLFRFLKHDLGWTTIRPRSPQSADRWSWLLAAGLWQVWLARTIVAEHRLPWERPRQPLSPGRVRRGMPVLFRSKGTPARPPNRAESPPDGVLDSVPAQRRASRCSVGRRPRPPEPPPRPAALSLGPHGDPGTLRCCPNSRF